MYRKLRLLGPLLGLAALMVSAAPLPGSPATAQAAPVDVVIRDFAFGPDPLWVTAGDTVYWTNQDSYPHDATGTDGTFATGLLRSGETGAVTFTESGTYAYYCSVHTAMTGTIVVQEPSEQTSPDQPADNSGGWGESAGDPADS